MKDGGLLVDTFNIVKFVKSMLNPMRDNGEVMYKDLFLLTGKQKTQDLFCPLLPVLVIVLIFTIFYTTM
jgi:hypothetical protein